MRKFIPLRAVLLLLLLLLLLLSRVYLANVTK